MTKPEIFWQDEKFRIVVEENAFDNTHYITIEKFNGIDAMRTHSWRKFSNEITLVVFLNDDKSFTKALGNLIYKYKDDKIYFE